MTVQTLFGSSSTIRFKQIRAVYETLTVKDEVTEYFNSPNRLDSPAKIYHLFSFLKNETKEFFFTLHLDGKNRIICVDKVSIGSLNQSIVHPREVFKTSLLSSAASLILLHNHPSGDPAPSSSDREISRRLKDAGELMGIRVLDHIVIGGESYFSFVESGLM